MCKQHFTDATDVTIYFTNIIKSIIFSSKMQWSVSIKYTVIECKLFTALKIKKGVAQYLSKYDDTVNVIS